MNVTLFALIYAIPQIQYPQVDPIHSYLYVILLFIVKYVTHKKECIKHTSTLKKN